MFGRGFISDDVIFDIDCRIMIWNLLYLVFDVICLELVGYLVELV